MADRNVYFTSDEKELGDDGRIPPPLKLVGAKLKMVAMKKVRLSSSCPKKNCCACRW